MKLAHTWRLLYKVLVGELRKFQYYNVMEMLHFGTPFPKVNELWQNSLSQQMILANGCTNACHIQLSDWCSTHNMNP